MSAPLIILAITFAIQLLIPKAPARQGLFGILVFSLAIAAIFGTAAYQSWNQYLVWQNNDLGKLFLPPYQSWDYFVFYARTRFFNSYFLSLLIGLVLLWTAKKMNQKYGERFFERVEPYLMATAIFVVGHPAWLFYLMVVLSVFLIINFSFSTFHFWLNKEMPRISLYYLWLPAAILVIIISGWLSRLPWWQTLKF